MFSFKKDAVLATKEFRDVKAPTLTGLDVKTLGQTDPYGRRNPLPEVPVKDRVTVVGR